MGSGKMGQRFTLLKEVPMGNLTRRIGEISFDLEVKKFVTSFKNQLFTITMHVPTVPLFHTRAKNQDPENFLSF